MTRVNKATLQAALIDAETVIKLREESLQQTINDLLDLRTEHEATRSVLGTYQNTARQRFEVLWDIHSHWIWWFLPRGMKNRIEEVIL